MAETQKFQEPAPAAPVVPEAPVATNPFVKAPEPVVEVAPVTTPLTAAESLWANTKALIRQAKGQGVDFEVLLRGALQEIERPTGV